MQQWCVVEQSRRGGISPCLRASRAAGNLEPEYWQQSKYCLHYSIFQVIGTLCRAEWSGIATRTALAGSLAWARLAGRGAPLVAGV